MAMAALRHATRRLACQQPPAMMHRAAVAEQPRRLLHCGSSAVGRNFSLAQEQRWMLPRTIHCRPPLVGRTYSNQQFPPFYRGEPNPNSFMEKAKEFLELYDLTWQLIEKFSNSLLKLSLAVAFVVDCCTSQYLYLIWRVMMGLDPPKKWLPKGGKEVTCYACGQALGEGTGQQQQKTE